MVEDGKGLGGVLRIKLFYPAEGNGRLRRAAYSGHMKQEIGLSTAEPERLLFAVAAHAYALLDTFHASAYPYQAGLFVEIRLASGFIR